MPPKRARKASVARKSFSEVSPKPARVSLAGRQSDRSPGPPSSRASASETPNTTAPPSPANFALRRESEVAESPSSPFSGGFSGPSFNLDHSASGFGDSVQTINLGSDSSSNPILGNDPADAEGAVRFDNFGVAEFVANVRVTKGRRIPVAVQDLARVKPLWKTRLVRVVVNTDGLGAHRSSLEILRLKNPESGSCVTNGMIQRIFLRSLDNIQRANVIPKHALPFFIPNPAAVESDTPKSPRLNERRSSATTKVAAPVVKEYRYGALLLRLGFTVGSNKQLHDLFYEEEHLRKVARTHGAEGLMKAAKALAQQKSSSTKTDTKRKLTEAVNAVIAKIRGSEGKILSSSTGAHSGGAAPSENREASDDDDEAIEHIDICFRSAQACETWYHWFNEFILEHELHELREDTDNALGMAAIARQQSLAAIFASVSDPTSSSDVLGESSRMFSEPGSTHFGRLDVADNGSGSAPPSPPRVGTRDPFEVPERPTDGVAQFISHFSSVDPQDGSGPDANKAGGGGGGEGGVRQAPCAGVVMKILKGGKTEKRKLLLGRRPGEVVISGGLTVRREVVDLMKARVIVETPWTRNFIIIPDCGSEITRTELDQLLLAQKKWVTPTLDKSAKDDAAPAVAETAVRKRPLIELRASRMEDREAFIDWLMKVRGVPQADHETHLYKAAEIAAAAAAAVSSVSLLESGYNPASENSFARNGSKLYDEDDHSGSPTRTVSMSGGHLSTQASVSHGKPLSRPNSGVMQSTSAPSEGSSGSQNRGVVSSSFVAPSGAMRPTTWNVEHVHRRSFLSANYHGKNIGANDRHDRGSSDASSSDEDEDYLPEYMIARPVVDPPESPGGTLSVRSPSGAATPVLSVKSDPLARTQHEETDPEVYDSEERGSWCYVAYHKEGFAPTPTTHFALRFVWLQAGERSSTPDAYSTLAQQTAAKRRTSGKIVIFQSHDLAAKPCVDALGADVLHLSRWSAIAGRAGFTLTLAAGPSQRVVVHIVPPDAKQHLRLVAYLQHRLWCPIYELQPDGAFGVTPADTPTMSAVEHRVAVMSAIDKIMKRNQKDNSTDAAPVTVAELVKKAAADDATRTFPLHRDALERHFAAELSKEVELAGEGALPCPLCGVERRQVDVVCRATGLFHADAIRARQRDAERGLLSSVFDALPPRSVEVPMPPAHLHGTTAALLTFNAHIEEVTSRGREAIESADDIKRRLIDTRA